MSGTTSKARLWLALPAAVAVGVVNVICFILFMVVYSYLIDPGHDETYYQESANRFGPISSIICGIPLMYLASRWLGRWVGPQFAVTAAVLMWLVYFVLDISLVAASGAFTGLLPVIAISFVTKFAAAYLGALHARKSAAPERN
jgi:hypothetical protein